MIIAIHIAPSNQKKREKLLKHEKVQTTITKKVNDRV